MRRTFARLASPLAVLALVLAPAARAADPAKPAAKPSLGSSVLAAAATAMKKVETATATTVKKVETAVVAAATKKPATPAPPPPPPPKPTPAPVIQVKAAPVGSSALSKLITPPAPTSIGNMAGTTPSVLAPSRPATPAPAPVKVTTPAVISPAKALPAPAMNTAGTTPATSGSAKTTTAAKSSLIQQLANPKPNSVTQITEDTVRGVGDIDAIAAHAAAQKTIQTGVTTTHGLLQFGRSVQATENQVIDHPVASAKAVSAVAANGSRALANVAAHPIKSEVAASQAVANRGAQAEVRLGNKVISTTQTYSTAVQRGDKQTVGTMLGKGASTVFVETGKTMVGGRADGLPDAVDATAAIGARTSGRVPATSLTHSQALNQLASPRAVVVPAASAQPGRAASGPSYGAPTPAFSSNRGLQAQARTPPIPNRGAPMSRQMTAPYRPSPPAQAAAPSALRGSRGRAPPARTVAEPTGRRLP